MHILTLKLRIFQNSVYVGLALSLFRQGEAVSTASYPGLLVKFPGLDTDSSIAEGLGARAMRLASQQDPASSRPSAAEWGSRSTLVFCGCQFSGQDVNSVESQYQDFESRCQLSVSWVLFWSFFTCEKVVMDGL